MRIFKVFALLSLLFLAGCLSTTGEIRGNQFQLENDFVVDVMDEDWQVVRQEKGVVNGRYVESSVFEVLFMHKKSNGFIGINSYRMSDVDKARSLEIHADDMLARSGALKLSQKMLKVNNIDAIELVISGKYMSKWIFFKKGDRGYELVYTNTSTHFDEYLGTFDKVIGTFKAL